MSTRRVISLLLLMVFAVSAATGVLFSPAIRFLIGISDEGFWRYVHFLSTNILVGLIIVHIIINVKTLGNYLKTARVFSITAFSLATIFFVGIICLGIAGPELGLTSSIYEEDIRRARSATEPTLISFPEGFEDGEADGWNLGQGWEVALENNNYILSSASNDWSRAQAKVSGWFDYTLTTKVKVINGEFQIHFRESDIPFRSGYMLGMNEDGFYLNREINEEYPFLAGIPPLLEPNEWHQIKIDLNKTNIKVYIDDELKLDYTDNDLPLIFGGFSFNIGPNSHVLFDDINVDIH
jgi:hypothetical protein